MLLLIFKLGGTLFQEGGHALLLVGSGEAHGEQLVLHGDAVIDVHLHAPVDARPVSYTHLLAAEFNGVEKASAVKDKLIEMTHLNETLYCCGIACSSQGVQTKAGNYQIDLLLANVCKQNVTRFPYEIVRLAEDVAGGLMVTMPSEADFKSDTVVGRSGETIGDICNKFFKARSGVSTEDRQRVMRFLENICLGAAAVGYRTESMHGAGSPQAQRIMISRQCDMEGKKKMARAISGIHSK